jgi:Family of unknown function (DUF6065)
MKVPHMSTERAGVSGPAAGATPGELIAYRIPSPFSMKLVAAPGSRDWVKSTQRQFAARCLPMHIANQAGWLILTGHSFRAQWLGGAAPEQVVVEQDSQEPCPAKAHFGEGILTVICPFLFRTPSGVSLLFRGPSNRPKDGIAALEAIVETDWAVAAASINWRFTRPGIWVEFEQDEPIAMVVPQRLDLLEDMKPRVAELADDPDAERGFRAWNDGCRRFNARLRQRDPEAERIGWLKYYARGTAPHMAPDDQSKAEGHRGNLQLREFTPDSGPADNISPRD